MISTFFIDHIFLDSIIQGNSHSVQFQLNDHTCNLPYWLADGIYPNWPVFAKTIPDPQGAASKMYILMQESFRKDVERAFVFFRADLQSFAIQVVNGQHKLSEIMNACIILHNMIVEDERDDRDLLNHVFENRSEARCRRIRTRRNAAPDHDIEILHTSAAEVPPASIVSVIGRTKEARNTDGF